MRMDARCATKVVARLRPVSPRPACGSSRTSSAPCYRTQPSAPLPAPRCARPSPGRTTKPRRTRAASHLRSCAAERAVARRIAVARASARLRGRTYRAPRFGEHDADAAFCSNPEGRGLPRHGQRSLGCGRGSMSAPVSRCFLRQLAPLPAPRYASPSSGRPDAWLCWSSLVWPPPNGAPHASPCIWIARRRNRVGLNQRFPNLRRFQ